MSPRDLTYLGHMLESARKIAARTSGLTRATFDADEDRQIVFTHLIQIIGEAAARISPESRSQLPQIPWKQVVGMRNKLVHDYLSVDLDIVWDVIGNHVPALVAALEAIAPLPSANDADVTSP